MARWRRLIRRPGEGAVSVMADRRQFLAGGAGFLAGAVATGSADAAGPAGATVLSGRGAPSKRLGQVGDFYINSRAHALYGPKRRHGWGPPTSLIGPRGQAGLAGRVGPAGPMGYSVLHGSGPPSPSLGEDNDFYIDTSSTQLYGPRNGGVWGSPVSLGEAPADALVAAAMAPDEMFVGPITRSSAGAPTGATVTWPDGTSGTYAGSESAQFPGAIDSYSVTYRGAVVRTYTQVTVTRNGGGNVIVRPGLTVS
jgi:hypothetical protein